MNKLGRHTKKDKIYSILGKIVVISFVFMLLFSQEANMLSFQERYFNINSGLFEENVNKVSSKQALLGKLKLLWMEYGQEVKIPHATCVIGSTVYIIEGDIEARDANTGKFLYSWESGFDLVDCAVLGNNLYVVGFLSLPEKSVDWVILKFTPDLKLVKENHYSLSDYNDFAYTVTTDGKYLYVGGVDGSHGDFGDYGEWHVIKVDPNDLSRVLSYTYNPTSYWDIVEFIGVNPFDGRIWVVGTKDSELHILQILDQDLSLVTSKYLGFQGTRNPQIAFDESGYAYMIGMEDSKGKILLKISPNLQIVETKYINADMILYRYGYFYLATSKYIDGYRKHVLMKATKDLNVIDELILSDQINADCSFYGKKMAIIANKLFVAGNCESYPEVWWVIYSVSTGEAALESTISVEDPVPFDRLFSINLRVKNLDSITISLKVALEERTGFQAGSKIGDGDEIKEITLNPGQEAELTFKAKVYGIQRIGDVARFKFYIGDKLIGQKDQILNLKPEVVEVSTLTSPAAVKKGSSFTIGVPVFYSLSMDTVLALILINEENGKKIVISDVVKGEGLKIYSIRVNSTIADLNLEGIKSFKLTVQSEYPEENYRVAYKKEFSFKVRVSNDVGSSSIVLDSGLVITLNYEGKQYYALYAYNATPSSPPQSGNIEDSFKWAYSQRNWLVFENIKGSFKPVMDDELYKTLAFAAEIAFLRATFWNNDYLVSRSNFFKDLRDLAIALETLNFIAKVAGKIAGMIALKGANSWASSVLSGTEASKLTRDLAMTVKITIEILEKIKLYENVLEAINKVGGAKEEVLVWLSIFLLNGGSDDLIAANKMLPNLTLYQPFVINVSDALTFYSYIQSGETKGLAAMRFLSTFYGKDQIDVMGVKISIRPFKGALIEALGFVGTAYEFYENLKNNFNNNEVFEYAQHLASVWMNYEIRKLICQSASLKFRDTYIRETSNSMEISLTEPGTQRKLYLTIYDTEGRIVGFDRKSGNVVAEIPNSYYLDFGNAIIIYVPLNVKIEKIVVDAIKSEQPIENYSLMIQVYKEGNLVSSTSLSSQININTKKEYSLQLTGDLKPILNELTTTPTTPSPSPTITSPTQTLTTSPSAAMPLNIELIIIIIVIAATLASLVIVFRKYKAK
jgi:hypothetical protein